MPRICRGCRLLAPVVVPAPVQQKVPVVHSVRWRWRRTRTCSPSTPRPSTSSPSGTGHRLHPAELPQAGSSSRKLNPPWRTGERVSNSLLERTHVEFSTKVLRDDDPVSGISGIGRRCVARLGEDCACCVCACCVRVVCVRVCVCVCVFVSVFVSV